MPQVQVPQTPAPRLKGCMRLNPGIILFGYRLAVAAVEAAIEQMEDSIRIDLQGSHFTPEAIRAFGIGARKLSIHELLRQQQNQRLLLAGCECCTGDA